MSTISYKCDSSNMDIASSLFESDKCIVGVSQHDDSSIIITDINKVVKYELNNRRILQEWRIVTGSTKLLTCCAVRKDDRFFAAVDKHTIVRWKNDNMYIDQNSKKFKLTNHCYGLIEHKSHLFVLYHDGSLSLFGDTARFWCHNLSPSMEVVAFNQLHKNQSNCDIFLILSDKTDIKVIKYEIQIQDGQVNVIVDSVHGCHSLLKKFTPVKPLKILYLDVFQCVAYGTPDDTKEEGIYMLNGRQESIRCCMKFDSKNLGNVVQIMRHRSTIMLVTTKQIIELDLMYKPPLFCNLISKDTNEDFIDEVTMECETSLEDSSFKGVCEKLKAWIELKGINMVSNDLLSVENDLQEFFTSSGINCTPNKNLKTNEILAFVSHFCKNSFNLKAKVFVEMISFLISLTDDAEYKHEATTLLNMALECTPPDDILKDLSLMDFNKVKIMMEHLYRELIKEELDIDKVVDWISLMLDSHHTQIKLSKDWEVILSIKQHVDALCEEAKEDSVKRFSEKLKFVRMQKRSKSRRGCYIEMFEL